MHTLSCPNCSRPIRPPPEAGSSLSCPDCRAIVSIDGSRVLDVSLSGARTMGSIAVGGAAPPAGADTSKDLVLSAEFSTRYRLGALLGSGASGMVYEATDLSDRRPVAIKFLIQAEDKKSLSRFLREAKCLSGIEHPNVVRVLDFNESGGRPYLVTEYLEGGSLSDRLAAQRMLRPQEAIEIILACLAGLAACHRAGVVHRDIKPSNILFGASGEPKLADLGIARVTSDEAKLTRTGDVVGTPLYMSPEQVRGEPATPASDLYAVGVLFYELLAGRPPFVAPGTYELMKMHLEQQPPPLRTLAPGVSDELAALIGTMLAKDPTGRPASAEALGLKLRRIRSLSGAGPTESGSPRVRRSGGPARTTERRHPPALAVRPAWVPAVVALGIAALIALGWGFSGGLRLAVFSAGPLVDPAPASVVATRPVPPPPPASVTPPVSLDALVALMRASSNAVAALPVPSALPGSASPAGPGPDPTLAFEADVARTLQAVRKLENHADRAALLRALQQRHPGRYSFEVCNELRHSLGNHPAAAAAEDEIMREEPMHDYILSIMGAWNDPKREPTKTAHALEDAADRYPALAYRTAACLIRAAECWLAAGRTDAAIVCAKRVLAIDGKRFQPYRRRAEELLTRIPVRPAGQ
jgi:serine/threonine-protein kinase